ncbi:hypothetical protein [Herbaspirillum seropedicae]|uniref:hypothetical protein n=1 Tax=Herbaspirillum seropedicae TaxID=964 RepID=UPI003FCC612C
MAATGRWTVLIADAKTSLQTSASPPAIQTMVAKRACRLGFLPSFLRMEKRLYVLLGVMVVLIECGKQKNY